MGGVNSKNISMCIFSREKNFQVGDLKWTDITCLGGMMMWTETMGFIHKKIKTMPLNSLPSENIFTNSILLY